MKEDRCQALVLYTRNYREKDKLAKIFTADFGKRMFFIKNAPKSKINGALQPACESEMILQINGNGFSFIKDLSHPNFHKKIAEDIFLNAHTTYMMALADAALPDNQVDKPLYKFLTRSIDLIEGGFDPEIITNIFEIQLLPHFGIELNFSECAFCHRRDLPLDFSFKYSGALCPNHFFEDERRSHLDPNVLYFVNIFTRVDLDKLESISLKPELKKKIREFVNELYDEYVGLHLKSKKFLDEMDKWFNIMKD
ncbi:DNA repair protein RecO [Streptococcaceae bacterium ESL0729]|nr:DNA repair protein RecO [Streptococcaceae bacterium ESL0729]